MYSSVGSITKLLPFLPQATDPPPSLRSKAYIVANKRWDPLTAGASSTLGTITNFTSALGGTFVDPFIQMKRVHDTGASGSSMTTTGLATAGVGLTSVGTSVVKGTLVNVPLALAEGFRNTPALYGDKVRDLGPVTDWKSGGVVAAKVGSPTSTFGSSPSLCIAQHAHRYTEPGTVISRYVSHIRPSISIVKGPWRAFFFCAACLALRDSLSGTASLTTSSWQRPDR